MAESSEWRRKLRVLRSKRDATRYQILVEIAQRQPAVNQAEIAEAVGVTPQAISEYLNGLVEEDHVKKLGRGRWEVTAQGVDWLIEQTDDLREFTEFVSEEVIERGDIEPAIAEGPIAEGDRVTLAMRDGVLYAIPDEDGPATATAITDAAPGEDVGVRDISGLLDFELGHVTIVVLAPVQDGGSRSLERGDLLGLVEEHDVIAVDRPEGLAAVRRAEVTPDLRFGAEYGVQEAAVKGQNVLLVTVTNALSRHTDRLRDYDIPYDVIEAHADG